VDGVICGHIHAAAIKEISGITYMNCGDWVDSCTAIVEHTDGRMELIEWGIRELSFHEDAAPAPLAAPEPGLAETAEQDAPVREAR